MPLPLSDTDYQALILAQVGDPAGTLAANLPTLWLLNSERADPGRLQYLFTLRDSVAFLKRTVWAHVDFSVAGDVAVKLGTKSVNLKALLDEVDAEIDQLLATQGGPQAGDLTTVEGIGPLIAGGRDANDELYRGSPYRPPLGGNWRL